MNPLKEFMDILINMLERECALDSKISLEELSEENSLYAEMGIGRAETMYYDKSTIKNIPVLFLCRHSDQTRCMGQLEEIGNHLQRLKEYPDGTIFRWIGAEIEKEPSKIGSDEDGVYHYSCIVNCKLYF